MHPQSFFLNIVALIIAILVACSVGDDNRVNLNSFYRSQDTLLLQSSIDADHKGIRACFIENIYGYLSYRQQMNQKGSDSLADILDWALPIYSSYSKCIDLSNRYRLYQSWEEDQLIIKADLDSIYRQIRSEIAQNTGDIDLFSKSKFPNLLTNIREKYISLPDPFMTAELDYKIARYLIDFQEGKLGKDYISDRLDIPKSLGDNKRLAHNYLLIAKYNGYESSDLLQAEKAINLSLASFRKIGLDTKYADLLRAYILSSIYQTDRAIELYKSLAKVFESQSNKENLAYCEYAIAEAYINLNELDSAILYIDKSINNRKNMKQANQATLGESYSCKAYIYMRQNKYKLAENAYLSAEILLESSGFRPSRLLNKLRMAEFYLSLNRIEIASEYYHQVLKESDGFEERFESMYGLAVCDYRQKSYDDAKQKLIKLVNRIEISRKKFPLPELTGGLLSDKIGIYQLLSKIYIDQYLFAFDFKWLDSAHYYYNLKKAKSLNDLIFSNQPISAEVDSLTDLISKIDAELVLHKSDSIGLKACLDSATNRLHFLRIEKADIDGANSSINVKINNQYRDIPKGTTVLEYSISQFGSYLYYTDENTQTVYDLEIAFDSLNGQIIDYLEMIRTKPVGAESISMQRSLGRLLYQSLLPEVVVENLRKDSIKGIVVIPDGILHHLPFETLIDHNGKFLIENYYVSNAPSISILNSLITSKNNSDSKASIVGFGNPSYGNGDIVQLPFAQKEVELVEKIFGEANSNILTGDSATDSRFLNFNYKSIDYLLLATHGIVNYAAPERSGLVLASNDNQSEHSLVNAMQISSKSVPVDLVYLSSCNSGTGKSYPGEGVLSFCQPFFIAGARSVVASYWNVNDRSSVDFAEVFFKNLSIGKSKTESLALAKRAMISSERENWNHPYYWAPFVLNGAFD